MKGAQPKHRQTINGVYYQISNSGGYQRHSDVSIHCHHPSTNYVKKEKMTNTNIENNPEKEQNRKNELFILKSRFAQNCKQILEKEEVNSIHQQDATSQSEVLKINNTYDRREKNMNMRRSTQNEFSPKKGILKRSLIDKKEQLEENQKTGRSVTINNELYTNNQMSPVQAQSQYQLPGNQSHHRQTLSWINPSPSYSRSNSKKCSQARFGMENNSDANFIRAQVQREGQRTQRAYKKSSNRQNTEGQETVAIKCGNLNVRKQQNEGDEEMINQQFEKMVSEQMYFLQNKLIQMERQLKQSEQRMRKYGLQRELATKRNQIELLKKQNETLKKNSEVSNLESSINFDGLEPIVKLVERKSTFIISFLVAFLICFILGKPNTCNKS